MISTSPTAKVLIADDDRVIADTLSLILKRDGYDARAVYTCRNALEMAPEFRPDILISDVLMTDLNGVDAAIEMRKLLPELRVFLLSGQSMAEVLEQSPVKDFELLVKPVHPRELLSKLRGVSPSMAA